jgi:zinc transport system permease protein
MSDFFHALMTLPLLRHALLMGALAAVACGVIGTYVVSRRITYIAGAIAHCVLGGLGAARYCQARYDWHWFHPLLGAALAAAASALVIGWVSLRAKEREDTLISAIWSVGMAAGVLFISQTPGYNEDLTGYLFGNILLVSPADLWLIALLDALIVAVGLLFYHKFLAVCFDEEFARLRGINVEFYYLLLLALTSLTVVVLLKVVGIIMVIALLTLPAAVAGFFSRTLWQMMLAACLICIALTTGGMAASYGPSLPVGATTIVLAGGLYLVALVMTRWIGSKRRRL